jgi:hypothetical protein
MAAAQPIVSLLKKKHFNHREPNLSNYFTQEKEKHANTPPQNSRIRPTLATDQAGNNRG